MDLGFYFFMEILNKITLSETPVQKITDEFILKHKINLFIKRIDLIHPQISGNKWFKLKYNLVEAEAKGYKALLTFGGAYSNHIHAVAAAGKIFGFETIGLIRGEEHLPLNPTLDFAKNCGMKIFYIDRTSYRKRYDKKFLNIIKKEFGNVYIIPEGGTNLLAVKGASEIIQPENFSADYFCTACGTGGTMAGIISSLKGSKNVLGFSVLKGASFLNDNVNELVNKYTGQFYNNWQINLDYHFGGYAKITYELINFTKRFTLINEIPIEPVYTGKMLFGIYDLIDKGFFKEKDTILALHTGGKQGLEGMQQRIGKLEKRTL